VTTSDAVNTSTTAASRDEVEATFNASKDLRRLLLADGVYDRVQVPNAKLNNLDLRRTNFQDSNLTEADMRGVLAVRAIFTKANLEKADLRGSDLRDALFNAADLRGADLRGCSFSSGTNLKGAKVEGAKIDRQSLRLLGQQHGGLSEGDVASMNVHDDLVRLTTGFGGFWSFMHLFAVTVFLLPYIAFTIRSYVQSKWIACQDCIPLREAIWNYALTGGQQDQRDIVAFVIFCLLLLYNIFRASLVYKAQTLRLAESASGFPTMFTLRGYWWVAYYGCQVLVWLNLALVALHAYQFLDSPVER